MLAFLLVLLVLVCIALSAVILMQRSEGGALGMGSSPSGLLTVSGAGDLLTKTTSVLGAAFFVLCLLLTILQGHVHSGGSVVDRLKVNSLSPDALNRSMRPATPAPAAAPAKPSFDAPAPEVHTAPATPSGAASQLGYPAQPAPTKTGGK